MCTEQCKLYSVHGTRHTAYFAHCNLHIWQFTPQIIHMEPKKFKESCKVELMKLVLFSKMSKRIYSRHLDRIVQNYPAYGKPLNLVNVSNIKTNMSVLYKASKFHHYQRPWFSAIIMVDHIFFLLFFYGIIAFITKQFNLVHNIKKTLVVPIIFKITMYSTEMLYIWSLTDPV